MRKEERDEKEALGEYLKKFSELEEERRKKGEKTWQDPWTEEELREVLCPGSLS